MTEDEILVYEFDDEFTEVSLKGRISDFGGDKPTSMVTNGYCSNLIVYTSGSKILEFKIASWEGPYTYSLLLGLISLNGRLIDQFGQFFMLNPKWPDPISVFQMEYADDKLKIFRGYPQLVFESAYDASANANYLFVLSRNSTSSIVHVWDTKEDMFEALL